MADRASIVQSSFLGGEYSPASYGRVAEPQYLTALAHCFNAIPIEEGPWQRRSGFMRLAPTANRNPAKLLTFLASTTCSFIIEATLDNIQFYSGAGLIFTNDARTIPAATSLSGGVITATTDAPHGWNVGDCVMLQFPAGYAFASEANCRGRIFQLTTGTTGSTLKMSDDLGNQLPTFTQTFVNNTSLVGATVLRVLRFTTTYSNADLPNLRLIQAQNAGIILASDVAPQALQVTTPAPAADPVFTFGALTMVDGPYLDPQTQSLTLSALSGAVTLTAGSAAFATTDVGRHLRVFTQPAAYNPAHAYSVGDLTTDVQGNWWTCIVANTGQIPGQPGVSSGIPTVFWVPNPTAGNWAWGKITAYTSATQVTWTIDTTISGMTLATANGTTASIWEMGVYSATTTYPTCGTYFEGRLYLAGAVANRFDTTVSNGVKNTTATFSPTDPWGNVIDTSGISLTLNANTLNNFNWMRPAYGGIVCGTFEGEWLIAASNLSDPITPTSIQAHLVTRYGSANLEPVGTGMAVVFSQRYGHRMFEYIDDAFTQKFSGKPLNEKALHLFSSGTAELAYQDEATPIIWARQNDGSINGCTYRRISRFITEDPKFNGWHPHRHGAPGSSITGIASLPAEVGTSDLLYGVVKDQFGYFVELMQPLMSATAGIRDGWYEDAVSGQIANITQKCGNLQPSVGQAGIGTVAATDWGEPLPAQLNLVAPGTVLPVGGGPALNFQTLNNGVYFNGQSFISGLLPITTLKNFSLSVWLYLVGQEGDIWSTPIPGSGVGYEDSPRVGQILYHSAAYSRTGAGAFFLNEGVWAHYMYSNNGGNGGNSYINDVSAGSTVSFNSGAGISSKLLMVGGNRQVNWNGITGGGAVFRIAGSQVPAGYGLVAGMAELWMDTAYIDWSVAANRAKFHASDLANLVYTPVSLGSRGQTPTGSNPQCYLSGGPKDFRINRAKKVRIQTYNNGPFGFFANNIDPYEVVLDSLPPSVKQLGQLS